MATAGRAVDSDLDRAMLKALLEAEPFRFHFFQAVRLLERVCPERQSVGNFVVPDREVARFAVHQSTSFPASEIQALTIPDDKPPRMAVNFMGLTGPLGLLALYYSEYVIQRVRAKDTALRDFLDIFNHRAISLFYRAWEKYRFGVAYERGERDPLARQLLALIGLGTAKLEHRQKVEDESLVYYAGLFAQQPRSAAALQQILADYFEVPVEVEQFAGAWYKLDRKSQTWLNESGAYTEVLGFGTVLGDEVWDQQSVVRLKFGPLTLRQYLQFLPTGSAWEPLHALVRFYFNEQLDFELQLILKREETPRCELGAEGDEAPRLGWVTWNKTAPIERDPGDAVLRLRA
ncbi:MAG: type VI secretion system baseplate subunit TssG [Terriglobales bacterium]